MTVNHPAAVAGAAAAAAWDRAAADTPLLFTKIPEFMTLKPRDGSWRIGRLGGDDFTFIIGLDARPNEAEIRQLQLAFLLALPVALALVGLGGWIVAGRALRPLRMIAETAAHVTSAGLDHRIPLSDEDPEIRRLIDTLNRMMDRLEQGFRQATRFSADASHELKTPLAIMRGELENALHEAAPGSREQQLFSSLLEETQRLAGITRSLLLLSRADAGQLKPALEEIDLSTLLDELLEDTAVLAAEAEIELQTQITPGIRVMADPLLLRSALLNVLTNAVKYNEPGGFIRVDLEADGHRGTHPRRQFRPWHSRRRTSADLRSLPAGRPLARAPHRWHRPRAESHAGNSPRAPRRRGA